MDYPKSAVRVLGRGCNLTEGALIKVTGKMQLFKHSEGHHSLPDYSVSLTAHSLSDKAHPSKTQTEKYRTTMEAHQRNKRHERTKMYYFSSQAKVENQMLSKLTAIQNRHLIQTDKRIRNL